MIYLIHDHCACCGAFESLFPTPTLSAMNTPSQNGYWICLDCRTLYGLAMLGPAHRALIWDKSERPTRALILQLDKLETWRKADAVHYQTHVSVLHIEDWTSCPLREPRPEPVVLSGDLLSDQAGRPILST